MTEAPPFRCRSCGAPLPAEGHSPGFSECRHCGTLHALAPGALERPRAPQTDRLQVETTHGGIRITYRWISIVDWLLGLTSLLLVPGLLMCIAAFLSNSFRGGPALFVALLAIGMGLFIANGLLGFVKRTLIEAEGGWLTVRQRPFSWSREMSFKATEIEQLTSSQEAHHAGGPGQREYRMYGLSAVPKGGQRVKLLGHLPEAADALFIEQRVETALGLVDRPTGGELSR